MSGVVISQDDLPHWAVDILNWIGMVQAMQGASGDIGSTYREQVKAALDKGEPYPYTNTKTGKTTYLSGPASIYGIYQSFCLKIEAEASK